MPSLWLSRPNSWEGLSLHACLDQGFARLSVKVRQAGLRCISALRAMLAPQPAHACLACRQAVHLGTQVDITDLPDIKSGFTVTFRFSEGNTLFANRELRKEYRFMEDGMLMVTGTEIDWLVVRGPATLPVALCSRVHTHLQAHTC